MNFKLISELHTVIIFALLFINNSTYSQVYDYIWAKNSTGFGQRIEPVKSITDKSGNIYTVGIFGGSPNLGNITLKSDSASIDIYIVKYNENGDIIWVKSFGGSGIDQVNDCAIDYLGNLYLIGSFSSKKLKTGLTTLTPFMGWDLLLISLDPDGNVLWSRNFGGDSNEFGTSCTLLSNGYLIITGEFSGNTMDIGTALTSNGNCYTQFYAELKTNADILRAFTIQECNDIFTTPVGLKCFSSNINCFYYLIGSDNTSNNVFLHKLGCGGIPDYNILNIANSNGGDPFTNGASTVNGASIDDFGNIYVWGAFDCNKLEISAKGSSNKELLVNNANFKTSDIFIIKISYDYKLLWARSFGNLDYDNINSCSIKSNDNIILTGSFGHPNIVFDNLKLDHDVNVNNDIFTVELDKNGKVIWAISSKATGFGSPMSTIDNSDNLIVYGNYTGQCTFGKHALDDATGNYYSFVTKLGITTSNENINSLTESIIIPNPNQGKFLIRLSNDYRIENLQIIDLDGKIIWSQMLLEKNNEFTFNLPPDIQYGTYILRLRNNEGTQILHKIVVCH